MSKDKSSPSNGIGFSSALFLVFLVLKLCEVINWSWWWVTAPLWINLAVVLLILLSAFVVACFQASKS